MSITPIGSITRRLPEAGRIRLGVKTSTKEGRAALDHFRFTGKRRADLDKVAEMYGGTVRPWTDAKADPGQFEVITETSEIEVVLPPDPLSVAYELWSGGGIQRRCDGETCVVSSGDDLVERECLCYVRGAMECKLKLRLSVLLPEVAFLGTWRLDTSSWNAAHELPGMVELIHTMGGSMVRAILRVEQRTEMVNGRKKRFIVPVLGLASTLNELAAGQAKLSAPALGREATSAGPTVVGAPELHPGPDGGYFDPQGVGPKPDSVSDDDVIEAEIVEETYEGLSNSDKARWLRLARQLAQAMGEPIPTTFDSITEPVLAAVKDHL
jgi:hypothetical protein